MSKITARIRRAANFLDDFGNAVALVLGQLEIVLDRRLTQQQVLP